MRRRKEHKQIDLAYLGYTNDSVHEFIDSAVRWLGAGHRIAYHSSAILDFAEIMWGEEGRKIALLHILIDAKVVDGKIALNKAKEWFL